MKTKVLTHSWPGLLAGFAVLLFALTGCQEDKAALTAISPSPQMGPNCASCHAYPPRDTNHTYHLFQTSGSIRNNHPITCLNCHNKSMLGHDQAFMDSVFLDPNGNESHTLDYPDWIELRTYPFVRIDTVVKNRPVPQPTRPGAITEIQEWMTGLAHMNGVVDVDFDPTSIDTAKFGGQTAVFHPKELTCSAMACHPIPGAYRWAIPSRGLPILKGDTAHVP